MNAQLKQRQTPAMDAYRAARAALQDLDSPLAALHDRLTKLSEQAQTLSQPASELKALQDQLHESLSTQFAGGAAADTDALEQQIAAKKMQIDSSAVRLAAVESARTRTQAEINSITVKNASARKDSNLPGLAHAARVETAVQAVLPLYVELRATLDHAYTEMASWFRACDQLRPEGVAPHATIFSQLIALPGPINLKVFDELCAARDLNADIAFRLQEVKSALATL